MLWHCIVKWASQGSYGALQLLLTLRLFTHIEAEACNIRNHLSSLQAAQLKLNGSGDVAAGKLAAAEEAAAAREGALRAERDQLAARAAGLETSLADLSAQLAAAKVNALMSRPFYNFSPWSSSILGQNLGQLKPDHQPLSLTLPVR